MSDLNNIVSLYEGTMNTIYIKRHLYTIARCSIIEKSLQTPSQTELMKVNFVIGVLLLMASENTNAAIYAIKANDQLHEKQPK
jgi:hypothetical protein